MSLCYDWLLCWCQIAKYFDRTIKYSNWILHSHCGEYILKILKVKTDKYAWIVKKKEKTENCPLSCIK